MLRRWESFIGIRIHILIVLLFMYTHLDPTQLVDGYWSIIEKSSLPGEYLWLPEWNIKFIISFVYLHIRTGRFISYRGWENCCTATVLYINDYLLFVSETGRSYLNFPCIIHSDAAFASALCSAMLQRKWQRNKLRMLLCTENMLLSLCNFERQPAPLA